MNVADVDEYTWSTIIISFYYFNRTTYYREKNRHSEKEKNGLGCRLDHTIHGTYGIDIDPRDLGCMAADFVDRCTVLDCYRIRSQGTIY